MSKPVSKFRWVSPDGRQGRWRANQVGAVVSAVNARFSSAEVKMSFDAASALAAWPGLKANGWHIEKFNGGSK